MSNFKLFTAMLMSLSIASTAWPDAEQDQASPPLLTIREVDDQETVWIGDQLFTSYHQDATNAYLYPIIGPTGASMTRGFPIVDGLEGESTDHPHHRSLWFAHGDVNGVDFWHRGNQAGTIRSVAGDLSQGPTPRADIASHNEWLNAEGETLAEASTTYRFMVQADGSRVIDFSTSITPAEGIDQVTFGDTKEGTMAIRLHPALRLKGEIATGQCINSEGDRNGDCWGKRAKWVAYWGVIDGQTCGVAVFDHPTNLRHPTWWHARDYGLVAANPFGIHDFERRPEGTGDYTLEQGETLELRYRFVFFAGTADEAGVAGKYDAWVAETTAGRPAADPPPPGPYPASSPDQEEE